MTENKHARPRTYARNRRLMSRRGNENINETDGSYLLKLVIFTLLGTMWIKFSQPLDWNGYLLNAIPAGLVVGLVLVSTVEKYQYNRKIWYAVLILVGIVSYFVPAGIIV